MSVRERVASRYPHGYSTIVTFGTDYTNGYRSIQLIGCGVSLPFTHCSELSHYTLKAVSQLRERGASIVQPDRPVRVVLFGFWLDELQTVSFTTTDNCTATPLIFEQVDFIIQTDKRVVVATQFPKTVAGEEYRLCIKSRSRHMNTPSEFLQCCRPL
ncbi:hypothetical protein Y032_0016g3072 [Ancylostoma ceylanicum]|uniref:Uncharacterized protein n=1 Tax=Ancylostoma ceylanicum TaxID=53326 RepID=A0A016V5S7_9BILA|nr:hypothetical protein Y032_0016g3072 [Ancylostoma ceylanicum]